MIAPEFSYKIMAICVFSLYLFFRKKIKFFIILPLVILSVAILSLTTVEPFRNLYVLLFCFSMLIVSVFAYKDNDLKKGDKFKDIFDFYDWLVFILLLMFIFLIDL
jgi:hypothetical protein